ncbi:MAG TPA: benzoate/H(+) symporter BenE family transporter [Roseiarcus sp.]|nr:benzoate/H(+) symporter BenE family transporter [Roseiarcus sp.]
MNLAQTPDVSHSTVTRVSLIQPLTVGVLAAVVGYASTFTIVLQGFESVGARPEQAASGLMVTSVLMGFLGVILSLMWRQPISIVWSTPASALLISTGAQAGGYPAAIGGLIAAAVLIVASGGIRPLGRLVAAIPASLANAMLAGILFEICLAPVHAAAARPAIVLPIVIAWVLGLRFARRFAVPIAMAVTAAITIFVTRLPPAALAHVWPNLVITAPSWNWSAAASLTIPLFIVTMASQNLPGLTVLRSQGYKPDVQKLFTVTGLMSMAGAVGGGGLLSLAAITAALTAGPEAHPNPDRRYTATVVAGAAYIALGLASPLAAALIVAAPTMAIKAVAGLALMTSFAGALASSLQKPDERVAVIATFVVSASGVSLFGVGASFWGLLVGGILLVSETWRRK